MSVSRVFGPSHGPSVHHSKDHIYKHSYGKIGLDRPESDNLVDSGWVNPHEWIAPMQTSETYEDYEAGLPRQDHHDLHAIIGEKKLRSIFGMRHSINFTEHGLNIQ